jgi:hypothetical protein
MMFLELDSGKGQLVNLVPMDLVLEVMKPKGNYMEEIYDPGEYKLTWMLYCYFSCITRLFYIKHAYFVTLMKYILELLGTLFCENVCRLIR